MNQAFELIDEEKFRPENCKTEAQKFSWGVAQRKRWHSS
jgi:hypothetical protein